MRWMAEPPRETDWKEWFAWHSVPLDTINTGDRVIFEDKKTKKVWLEKVERRKVAGANNRFFYIYRDIGSVWDIRKTNRPPAPPSNGR